MQSTTTHRGLWPICALALLVWAISPRSGAAEELGCCQLNGRCVSTQQSLACAQAQGQFSATRVCNATRSLCVEAPLIAPRVKKRPPPRVLSSRRIQARPVRPHGPHVVLVPAVTATRSPNPTPTPTSRHGASLCCQLAQDNRPFCTAPLDPFTCHHIGGSLVPEASCDGRSGLCRSLSSPRGCCQIDGDTPWCTGAVTSSRCVAAGGVFIEDAACNGRLGLCVQSPVAPCGNGVIEPGEECERDADCGNPAEGCTDSCHCAGGLEVLLRWTNQNDLDLTVIDPRGNIYVPTHDANPECRNTTNKPEEFVFLPPGRAPIGCYTVLVHYDQRCPETRGVDTHLDIRLNLEGTKSTLHDVPGPQPEETFETKFGLRATCR